MKGAAMRFAATMLAGMAALLPVHGVCAEETTVLLWQVGDMTDFDSLEGVIVHLANDGGTTTAKDLGVSHARIREVSTGGYLGLQIPGSDSFGLDSMNVPMTWAADVSDFAGGSPEYAFVIELGAYESGSWSTLAVSESASYVDLVANHHIDVFSGYQPLYATPWNPTTYAVPEPASGLLVLVGAALLALRRGRVSRCREEGGRR
ncbi:MAG: PEP-CTERM sorting domain-containing protein [Kiritimatiellae bacterium]|nr:PEP-CTERM sorting domain-containing protein [Kiritimatiellia bacterium]